MGTRDTAVMALVFSCAVGYLLSDGELRRVYWIRAMRQCLGRMNGIILYEQVPLGTLLKRIEMKVTPQERALTKLLHRCAEKMEKSPNPQLMSLFFSESIRLPEYGTLSEEDRSAFEAVLLDLGRMRMQDQLRMIDQADERLRAREEELKQESKKRAQMYRTLGAACGAALFLILV